MSLNLKRPYFNQWDRLFVTVQMSVQFFATEIYLPCQVLTRNPLDGKFSGTVATIRINTKFSFSQILSRKSLPDNGLAVSLSNSYPTTLNHRSASTKVKKGWKCTKSVDMGWEEACRYSFTDGRLELRCYPPKKVKRMFEILNRRDDFQPSF